MSDELPRMVMVGITFPVPEGVSLSLYGNSLARIGHQLEQEKGDVTINVGHVISAVSSIEQEGQERLATMPFQITADYVNARDMEFIVQMIDQANREHEQAKAAGHE